MVEKHDLILVYITQVTNVDRMKELYYLVSSHKDIIHASDIYLTKRKKEHVIVEDEKSKSRDIYVLENIDLETSENPLWLLIENNGKGIYLASKIYRKFQPWVSMGIVKNIYFHDFPEEFKEMKTWNKRKEKDLMKKTLKK